MREQGYYWRHRRETSQPWGALGAASGRKSVRGGAITLHRVLLENKPNPSSLTFAKEFNSPPVLSLQVQAQGREGEQLPCLRVSRKSVPLACCWRGCPGSGQGETAEGGIQLLERHSGLGRVCVHVHLYKRV